MFLFLNGIYNFHENRIWDLFDEIHDFFHGFDVISEIQWTSKMGFHRISMVDLMEITSTWCIHVGIVVGVHVPTLRRQFRGGVLGFASGCVRNKVNPPKPWENGDFMVISW